MTSSGPRHRHRRGRGKRRGKCASARCTQRTEGHSYRPLSRFPAVERDFSLVLADGTAFAAVVETIRALGIVEVSSIDAVDVFRGKNVPEGKFSLLVRVTFESHHTTLTEAQLTDFSSRILAALEQKLGAALRA